MLISMMFGGGGGRLDRYVDSSFVDERTFVLMICVG